jgi:hypothetical protein
MKMDNNKEETLTADAYRVRVLQRQFDHVMSVTMHQLQHGELNKLMKEVEELSKPQDMEEALTLLAQADVNYQRLTEKLKDVREINAYLRAENADLRQQVEECPVRHTGQDT